MRLEDFHKELRIGIQLRQGDFTFRTLEEAMKALGVQTIIETMTTYVNPSSEWELTQEQLFFFWSTMAEYLFEVPDRDWHLVYCCITDSIIKSHPHLEYGTDYRVSDGLIMYNRKALSTFLPAETVLLMISNPVEVIEEKVGMAGFFDRLSELVHKRLQTYCEKEAFSDAASYIGYMLDGLKEKFKALDNGEFGAQFILYSFDNDKTPVLIEWSDNMDEDQQTLEGRSSALKDIIRATGLLPAEEGIYDKRSPWHFSYRALKALNRVWERPVDPPIKELLVEMERQA